MVREIIVVASTWVLNPDPNRNLVRDIQTKKLIRIAPLDANQKCIAITLDNNSAITLLNALASYVGQPFESLKSGLAEHTVAGC